MVRRASFLAIALVLAGCGAERITTTTDVIGLREHEQRALVGSPRHVEVLGSPADGSSAEALAALMRFPGERNDRAFTVVPPRSPGIRIIAEWGGGSRNACVNPTGSSGLSPTVLTLTYCVDGRQLSAATMRSDTMRGPADPAFARALDRTMMALTQVEPMFRTIRPD